MLWPKIVNDMNAYMGGMCAGLLLWNVLNLPPHWEWFCVCNLVGMVPGTLTMVGSWVRLWRAV